MSVSELVICSLAMRSRRACWRENRSRTGLPPRQGRNGDVIGFADEAEPPQSTSHWARTVARVINAGVMTQTAVWDEARNHGEADVELLVLADAELRPEPAVRSGAERRYVGSVHPADARRATLAAIAPGEKEVSGARELPRG